MRCLYKDRQQSSSCSICNLQSLLRTSVVRASLFPGYLFVQPWMCSKTATGTCLSRCLWANTCFRSTSENIFLSCKPIWLMLRKGYWLSANPFCNAHHTLLPHSRETNRTVRFKPSSSSLGQGAEPQTSPRGFVESELQGTPQQDLTGGILVLFTASEWDFSLTPSLTKTKSK